MSAAPLALPRQGNVPALPGWADSLAGGPPGLGGFGPTGEICWVWFLRVVQRCDHWDA